METMKREMLELQPTFPDIVALDVKKDQHIAKNETFQALVCWERALFLRQHYLGYESGEVWDQARVMCEYCTKEAAEYLRKGDLPGAHKLLLKAEALSTKDDALRVEILNHLACYYRRLASPKLRAAYDLLKKAMKIDRHLKPMNHTKAAEVRLNACAILSLLGRHDKALSLAQEALILLQEELMAQPQENESKENYTAQAVAHHNIAVEEEFLHKTAQSLHSYRRAATLAATHCGEDHPLTCALKQSLEAAEDALSVKKKHKLFQQGRDAKVKSVYGSKSPKREVPSSLSNATKKAYNIGEPRGSFTELENEMKPVTINISQFDEAALSDNFDMNDSATKQEAKVEEAALPSVDVAVALLTPRHDNNGDVALEEDNHSQLDTSTADEKEANEALESQDKNSSEDQQQNEGDNGNKEQSNDSENKDVDVEIAEGKNLEDKMEDENIADDDAKVVESEELEAENKSTWSEDDDDADNANDEQTKDTQDDSEE